MQTACTKQAGNDYSVFSCIIDLTFISRVVAPLSFSSRALTRLLFFSISSASILHVFYTSASFKSFGSNPVREAIESSSSLVTLAKE